MLAFERDPCEGWAEEGSQRSSAEHRQGVTVNGSVCKDWGRGYRKDDWRATGW